MHRVEAVGNRVDTSSQLSIRFAPSNLFQPMARSLERASRRLTTYVASSCVTQVGLYCLVMEVVRLWLFERLHLGRKLDAYLSPRWNLDRSVT